jgi:acyl dehydratase
LNGDLNPLHSYPQAALKAGFNRPILHGLCSFGVAAHAVMRTYCGYDATRMKAIDVRFSAPVFPGETLSIEMWRDENIISFRAFVRARDVKVLDSGKVIVQ